MALDVSQLVEILKRNAELAVTFDSEGNKEAAIYYYLETVAQITQASSLNTDGHIDLSAFISKAKEYTRRAETLKTETVAKALAEAKITHASSGDLERAKFLLIEALNQDEGGQHDEAVKLYSEAIDLCLRARKETDDEDLKGKLNKIARKALERAEHLKAPREEAAQAPPLAAAAATRPVPKPRVIPPLGFNALDLKESPEHSAARSSGGGGYTEEEKKVLAKTSFVNGREYVPFLSVDLKERFAFPMPFSDRDGKLQLAPKQKDKLDRWARPDEFMNNPCVLYTVDCFSVKQTVVSDCSFVASIAISAQYEKRFGKRLITSIIYPQDKSGSPVYNPCGKYMIKLRINGVSRKIIVDDYFPLGRHGELLCSYSSNRNELWISLLEKAYMKVMGGYDFPGSNSNIDLYALTGWIPERISIKPDDPVAFNKDAVFRKLLERFHKGHVLVTMATGEMTDAAADRAGLVPTHAYAMLDIRDVKGVKLFLLKNPWSHLRWRGNYSEIDTRHWTPEMQKALNYDPKNAKNFDNGVFWVSPIYIMIIIP
jgi:calpain-7